MIRIAAHYVYCNAQQIIPKGVVELNKKGIVERIFSLHDCSEIENTIFYNGVICLDFISLNKEFTHNDIFLFSGIKNVSLSEIACSLIHWQNTHVDSTLWNLLTSLIDAPILHFPIERQLAVGNKVKLVLLEGIDYTRNQLSSQFSITAL